MHLCLGHIELHVHRKYESLASTIPYFSLSILQTSLYPLPIKHLVYISQPPLFFLPSGNSIYKRSHNESAFLLSHSPSLTFLLHLPCLLFFPVICSVICAGLILIVTTNYPAQDGGRRNEHKLRRRTEPSSCKRTLFASQLLTPTSFSSQFSLQVILQFKFP